MGGQIGTLAAKRNALHLKAHALFGTGRTGQPDLPTRSYDALPGERTGRNGPQQPGHGAMVERISRSRRNLPVSGNAAFRNRENHAAESGVTKLVRAHGSPVNTAFQVTHK
jgi:hypothetical protein